MLIFNPRQTVLITCQGEHEVLGKVEQKHDIIPSHWHSPVSQHPPMYAVFLHKSLMAVQLIRSSRCFVVNFMPYELVDTIKTAMRVAGEFTEKCDAIGVHESPCIKIDCFRLKEAVGFLECEVTEEKELGDHVMFIGKVLLSEEGPDVKRPFHVEGDNFTTTR
jgi:flavin reductase (DIM6/NTAB) family NADH-FMN oxidoreductase RutF